MRRFHELDLDGSESLTDTELLAETDFDAEELRHRFRVFDTNHDLELSLAEYLTLPGLIPMSERGPLTDPVADRSQQQIEELLGKLNLPTPAKSISSEWAMFLPTTVSLDSATWDRNHDGQVDEAEVRLCLEMAFGLRREDGQPARWPNGFVFNGSYFSHLDKNHDGRLSSKEFTSTYFAGPDQALKLLTVADTDQNDQLTLIEIDAAGLLRTDIPTNFLTWDRNQDGQIDEEELNQGKSWQRNLATHSLPAFDVDKDGGLSLVEFQLSPLGNPLFNWTSPRTDENSDGQLDLTEFFPPKELISSALAAAFFTALDLNQNQQLDFIELDFHVDEASLSAERLLKLRDQDEDGMLSVLELLSPLGVAPLADAGEILIPGHLAAFEAVDLNRDGRISPKEFALSPELHGLAQLEQQLRTQILLRFQKQDRDSDAKLTHDEWLQECPETLLESRRQEFALCDFDGDQQLTFTEFACVPSISSIHLRPGVVDPILDEMRSIELKILKQFPIDSPTPGAAKLVAAASHVMPFFSAADLVGWDSDSDGGFQSAEIQLGLEKLFMIRGVNGQWLRRPNGQVFNRRTWEAADRDDDDQLSHMEFITTYWKQGSAAETDFQKVDANRDQTISLNEVLSSDLYWIDTQLEFLRFDTNQNGALTADELSRNSTSHEKKMAENVLPAFDQNRDGELSFREFRLSPLANPVHDYNARRWDLNYDGRLSLAEYHRGKDIDRNGIGLSFLFLTRLDGNRDRLLAFNEYPFSADLKREPTEVVFQMLDTNADGHLLLPELLPRERPRDHSAWSQRRSEQRVMEVEDAFLSADTDRDHKISLAEFQSEEASIREVILGMSLKRSTADRSNSGTETDPPWRMIALIACNVCLFLGLGWWWLRR